MSGLTMSNVDLCTLFGTENFEISCAQNNNVNRNANTYVLYTCHHDIRVYSFQGIFSLNARMQ